MSEPTKHDSLAAEMLEVAGNMAALLGRSFGRDGAGMAAKAITHLAAEAIRRGVTTDQLVVTLRHVSPLEMPWGEKP
jgi:hypothetical protein